MVEPYSNHKTEKRCFAKMSSCFSSVVNSCLGKSILDCFLRQAGVFSFPLSLTKVRRYKWKCCVWSKVSRKFNWINPGSKAPSVKVNNPQLSEYFKFWNSCLLCLCWSWAEIASVLEPGLCCTVGLLVSGWFTCLHNFWAQGSTPHPDPHRARLGK